MSQVIRDLMRYVESMGIKGWLLALTGVILVGVLCLRGFGSRSNY